MIIYRIENREGWGPYRGSSVDVWSKRSHETIKTPTPFRDKLLSNFYDMSYCINNYKFGFKTKKQLFGWFNKYELGQLHKLKFKIVRLTIPDDCVVIGDKQVMYEVRHVSANTKSPIYKKAV